jgi:hypothetical protein
MRVSTVVWNFWFWELADIFIDVFINFGKYFRQFSWNGI